MMSETSSAEKLIAVDTGESFEKNPAGVPESSSEKIPEAAMEAIRRETAEFLESERDRITLEAQAAEQEILDPEKRSDVVQADKDITKAQENLAKLAAAIDSGDNEAALNYLDERKNELKGRVQLQEQNFNRAKNDLKEYNVSALQSELEVINTKKMMDIYPDLLEAGRAQDDIRLAELQGALRDIERYNQDVDTIADRLNRAQEMENQAPSEISGTVRTQMEFEAKDLRDRAQFLKDKFKDPSFNKYGEAASRVTEAQIALTELQDSINSVDRAIEGVQSAIQDEQIKQAA